jgi:hypothetical protein
MYGFVYPSSGLYFRHVKNLSLNTVDLEVRNEDFRPAIILNDVLDAKLETISGTAPAGNRAFFVVEKSENISIENSPETIETTGNSKSTVMAGQARNDR